MNPKTRFLVKPLLGVVVIAAVIFCLSAFAFDFGVDRDSPEVPARTPSDIYDSRGANVVVPSARMGLRPDENVDAMSYGHDQITPLGPMNFVSVTYSVTRNTMGSGFGAYPGSGAVAVQASNNGAAGDKFYINAIGNTVIGMVTFIGGLRSDATMHNLTPLPPVQSDLDQMSGPSTNPVQPIYFSVDPSTQGKQPDVIYRVTPLSASAPLTPPPTISEWANAADLGIQGLGWDINALAVSNRGDMDKLDSGDTVWASKTGDPRVYQLYPRVTSSPVHPAVVLEASNLGLRPTDDLNALTGIDPGPETSPCWDPKTEYTRDAEAIYASAEALVKRSVETPFEGALGDAVSFLEELAGRKFRLQNIAGLPGASVNIEGKGESISAALEGVLKENGLVHEIDLSGDVVICEAPSEAPVAPEPPEINTPHPPDKTCLCETVGAGAATNSLIEIILSIVASL